MEKLEAHEKGLLHRAFSVFVFNTKNELLLQQRALGKYHSEGLWTNTCCSHPAPGESITDAAKRRLLEEMGIQCPLEHKFNFIYKAELDKGLTEFELDHVLVGKSDSDPKLNLSEAKDYKWMALEDIVKDISNNPDSYTEWFKIILHDHYQQLRTIISNEDL